MAASDYMATTPLSFNKTKRKYLWFLPRRINSAISAIMALPKSPFDDVQHLTRRLDYWFGDAVMGKADVPTHSKANRKYTMRSIRCTWATDWIKRCADCRVLRWPEPPNPLQHEENAKTVLNNYAEPGADSEIDARKRCWELHRDRMIELYGKPIVKVPTDER